jgi:topoisomerase-4 subunit A
MIDNPNKEESFISDHPNSQLEIVSTDYRPMAEVIFSKKSLDKIELNFEDFIAVKGIKALGNQLTTDKIKQINLLESLAYEEPEINDVDLIEEEVFDSENEAETPSKKSDNKGTKKDDGQIDLFMEEDN